MNSRRKKPLQKKSRGATQKQMAARQRFKKMVIVAKEMQKRNPRLKYSEAMKKAAKVVKK